MAEEKKCEDCGKPLAEKDAITVDPYQKEIYDMTVKCYICKDCATERSNDV